MRPKPKIKDGWKMTEDQHRLYWRLLNQAFSVYRKSRGNETLTFESFRALIHARAFGRNISAKDIERMKMFGDFKAACTAIIAPNSLDAQLAIAQANEPRTLLIHRILNDFPATYILGLLNSPRFAHCNARSLEDMERMTEKDLRDLRNTLCARKPVGVQASACAIH